MAGVPGREVRVLLTLTTKRGRSGVAVSAFPPPNSLLSSFIPSLSTDSPLASLLLDPKGCPDREILQHLELVPLRKGRGRGGTDSHHIPPLQCPCHAGLRAPKCPESACKDIIYTQTLYFTGQHLDAASTSRHPVGKDLHVLPSCLSFPKPTASAIATPPPRPLCSRFPLHQLHFQARALPSSVWILFAGAPCRQHTASAQMSSHPTPSF